MYNGIIAVVDSERGGTGVCPLNLQISVNTAMRGTGQ